MRRPVLFLIVISLALIQMTGCVFVLGGAAGALGAYGLSKDSMEGDTDTPYENLWSAVTLVSRARGTIKKADKLQGLIELEVNSSRVWIQLTRVTPYTTRLKVAARKYRFPNLNLAQDLYAKIIEQVRQK
ncbi:MAG: hypothetical protein AMJ95_06070 [Omnitrophica WOR_2 bacterium SM23_72]|nr:MAG: hypothetical protein AMJ95_06070 [Omnitrophica WOR_2 bacterium SM23_72]